MNTEQEIVEDIVEVDATEPDEDIVAKLELLKVLRANLEQAAQMAFELAEIGAERKGDVWVLESAGTNFTKAVLAVRKVERFIATKLM